MRLAPTSREPRHAESVMGIADSAPKRYSTLTRRTALVRGSKPLKRTPLRWKPRTTPYGGESAEFPNVGDFQAFIRRRDGSVCQWCRRHAVRLDVAHLLWKVGMGGRKTSTVNERWNACLLCRDCHDRQERSRSMTADLVWRLKWRHGYELPLGALRDLERVEAAVRRDRQEAEEWPNGFDPELSPTG
jgi:hypothetical protein